MECYGAGEVGGAGKSSALPRQVLQETANCDYCRNPSFFQFFWYFCTARAP